MRKLIAFVLSVCVGLGLAVPAAASYDPATDYMNVMIRSVMDGNVDDGVRAEQARNEKIDALGLPYPKIAFDDLLLLSRVVYREAGSSWLSEEWKMSVGEVVLNRVESPEFPNSVREVVMQPGQYGGLCADFQYLRPSQACVEAALRLLCGERVLNEPSVVFQSNDYLGSGVYKKLSDSELGVTYLCYSSHPELY